MQQVKKYRRRFGSRCFYTAASATGLDVKQSVRAATVGSGYLQQQVAKSKRSNYCCTNTLDGVTLVE
jgi:hypothetical protein